jgi:hypothetical protein
MPIFAFTCLPNQFHVVAHYDLIYLGFSHRELFICARVGELHQDNWPYSFLLTNPSGCLIEGLINESQATSCPTRPENELQAPGLEGLGAE